MKDFWPRYWGGIVILDRSLDFFKALGGGKLLKDKFITGFIFNSRAIANYKRAKSMGIDSNYKGEGEIKGGLFIIGSGKSGIAYQFIERNFGDWAPLTEVIEICNRIQVLFIESSCSIYYLTPSSTESAFQYTQKTKCMGCYIYFSAFMLKSLSLPTLVYKFDPESLEYTPTVVSIFLFPFHPNAHQN